MSLPLLVPEAVSALKVSASSSQESAGPQPEWFNSLFLMANKFSGISSQQWWPRECKTWTFTSKKCQEVHLHLNGPAELPRGALCRTAGWSLPEPACRVCCYTQTFLPWPARMNHLLTTCTVKCGVCWENEFRRKENNPLNSREAKGSWTGVCEGQKLTQVRAPEGGYLSSQMDNLQHRMLPAAQP